MKDLSQRIQELTPSQSLIFSSDLRSLRERGKDIIGLNVGEPEFQMSPLIAEAMNLSLIEGKTKYSALAGEQKILSLLSQRVNEKQGLNTESNQVVLGNGSKHILYGLLQCLCGAGDEVLIFTPYWVSFPEMAKLAGATPVILPTGLDKIDINIVKEAITPRTKVMIINTPNNPSGHIYSENELLQLGELAREHQIFIISDEAYESIVFDQQKMIYPAQVADPELSHTCIVQSFSKSFCMTGLRLGYGISNHQVINSLKSLYGHLSGNVSTVVQYGGIAALENEHEILNENLKEFQKRRDLALSIFQKDMRYTYPMGAFYLFIDVSEYLSRHSLTDQELAQVFLREDDLAILPGSYFGSNQSLRMSFTTSLDNLERACLKIRTRLCS